MPLRGHLGGSGPPRGGALAFWAGSLLQAASAVHPVEQDRARREENGPKCSLAEHPRGELAQRRKSVPCKGFSCHDMAFGVLLELPREPAVGADDHVIASFS